MSPSEPNHRNSQVILKRILYFIWLLGLSAPLVSQPVVTDGEYFIDSDPGLGNATPFTLTPGVDVTRNINVDVSSVSSGIHNLYFRVKDSDLNWSLTRIRPFIKITPTNVNFDYAEYFFNTDPGLGNGISIPVPIDTVLDLTFPLNLSSLADGFHIFYIRVRNEQGFWTLTQNRPIVKITDPNTNIQRIEYFWDGDPGEGSATPVTFTPNTDVSVVFSPNLSGLADGFHNFYVRVQNQNGFWSLTNVQPFFKVTNSNADIVQAEYFIDADPGFGLAEQIVLDSTATDISQNFLVNLSAVSAGFHNLYVRVKNSEGLWSLTHNRPFFKASGGSDLVELEYFFDTDPGHGSGNSIPLGNVQDTAWTGVLDLTAIPQGNRTLYVRAKDSNGNWSITNSERFIWCNGPQINIGTLTDTICLGAPITVWDSTTNLDTSTTYAWDWESDGIVDDTTLGSVTHTYLDTGTYFLTLVATSFDTCYDSTAIRITVLPPPVAEFVADTVCRTFLTSLSDSSFTALPASYSWDFDNDFISDSTTVGDVQHVYPTTGIFPTNLIIDMGYNCIDTFSADVLVKEQPVALYAAPGNCLGETTVLNDISTNVLVGATYSWDVQGNGLIDDTTSGSISLVYPDTGTYQPQLIIDNQNGCIDTLVRDVIIHGLPQLNSTQSSPTCFGGFDGQATVNVFGDPSKYTYRWSDENNQTTQTASNLYARTYFVSVVDSNGCYNRDTVEVINPPKIDLSVITTDAQCGQNTGSALLTINSGVPPFELYWTNGDTTLQTNNLGAGIYIATVIDAQGCENIIPALVNNTNAPVGTINNAIDVSCFGLEDGAIDVNVSGGATPYTYQWSNRDTTEDISGLAPGPYELKITGADSCISFVRGIVGEPDKILVDVEGFESYCGLPTGSALANVSGGSGPVTFTWSSGGTGALEQNLNAGVYTVDVTDTNNCTAVGYVAISDTGSADIFVDSLVDVTCGLQNGGMYIKVLRVRGEPDYLWNNGDTTQDLINVNVGLHFVQVADSNNCKAFEFGVLDYIAPIPNPICLITIDTLDSIAHTEAIFVVWEKLNNPAVESYNVYKETTQSSVYQRIGNVKKTDPGIFIDSFSSVSNRWWRYKITVLDSCGNESDINAQAASAHKTIQLNASLDSNGHAYLIWDRYIGFQFTDYLIYRYTNVDGYKWVDTVLSSQLNYVDSSLPPNADTTFYFIFAENAFVCDPNKADDYGRVRSNTSAALFSPLIAFENEIEIETLIVYPIPAKNKLYVMVPKEMQLEYIEVRDMSGNTVLLTDSYSQKQGLDIKNLVSGVYFVRLQTSDRLFVKKMVKE